MVTFRFYLVSTVAFFLALSVGVMVGSVLDGRIADSLQDRLDGVERSLDETVASIDAKNDRIARMEQYMDESAPFVVQERLPGTATFVTAESGVDSSVAEDLVRRLRQAGSMVEGVVWLDRRLDLTDEKDRQTVARITALADTSDPEALRAALWSAVFTGATGSTQAASTTTTPTTTTAQGPGTPGSAGGPQVEPTPSDTQIRTVFDQGPLVELADAGLVRLQRIDGGAAEVTATELLVTTLSGADSTLTEPGVFSGEVATASVSAGLPTVLTAAIAQRDTAEGSPEVDRSELLVVPDSIGDATVSTVDDLEWIPGRVATVLALADLREGRSGRYGLGADVDGMLPPWQGP